MATKDDLRAKLTPDDDGFTEWEDQGGYSRRVKEDGHHIASLSPEQMTAHKAILALQEKFVAELEALAHPVGIVFDIQIALALAPPGTISPKITH